MCQTSGKPVPYKHAMVIKAWAEGLTVQFERTNGKWVDLESGVARGIMPSFYEHFNYRIKPEPTDLERYGVEVGDVWETVCGHLCTVRRLGEERAFTANGNNLLKKELANLLFRRGEVNKL